MYVCVRPTCSQVLDCRVVLVESAKRWKNGWMQAGATLPSLHIARSVRSRCYDANLQSTVYSEYMDGWNGTNRKSSITLAHCLIQVYDTNCSLFRLLLLLLLLRRRRRLLHHHRLLLLFILSHFSPTLTNMNCISNNCKWLMPNKPPMASGSQLGNHPAYFNTYPYIFWFVVDERRGIRSIGERRRHGIERKLFES